MLAVILSVNDAECFVVPNVVHYMMLRPDHAAVNRNATLLEYPGFLEFTDTSGRPIASSLLAPGSGAKYSE